MKTGIVILMLFLAPAMLFAQTNTFPEASRSPIAPQDQIEVSLRGIPQPGLITDVVGTNGCITLPFLGPVMASGMTTGELATVITRSYVSNQFYKTIVVGVRNLGEVVAPKRQPTWELLPILPFDGRRIEDDRR